MDNEFTREVQKSCSVFFQKNLVAGKAFPRKGEVDDDSLKFLLLDSDGQPCYFASCSTPASPNLIKRGAERAEHIHGLLPQGLGKHILKADLVGAWEGLSYAVYPYCHPLPKSRIRRFITRTILRKSLLNWLLNSTKETMVLIEGEDRDNTLQYLVGAQSNKVSPVLRKYCSEAQKQIELFNFQPYNTFCHNDLWEGNILLGSDKNLESDFKVIDWAGSAVKGYPIYDLLRFNSYLRMSEHRLKGVLINYSQALNCKSEDLKLYLALSLACLYEQLEYFPLDRFNKLSVNMFNLIESSVDG